MIEIIVVVKMIKKNKLVEEFLKWFLVPSILVIVVLALFIKGLNCKIAREEEKFRPICEKLMQENNAQEWRFAYHPYKISCVLIYYNRTCYEIDGNKVCNCSPLRYEYWDIE